MNKCEKCRKGIVSIWWKYCPYCGHRLGEHYEAEEEE